MNASETFALLPPGTAVFMRRRFLEAAGAAALALAASLALALSSYNVSDPSLNNATVALPTNALGWMGAVAADFLLQGFGLASGLLPLGIAAWGWRLLGKNAVSHLWLRALALIAAVLSMSIAIAWLPEPPIWPFISGAGGAWGTVVFARIAGGAGSITAIVLVSAMLLLGTGLTLYGLALPLSDWQALVRGTRSAVRSISRLAAYIGARTIVPLVGLIRTGRRQHQGAVVPEAAAQRQPPERRSAPAAPEDLIAPPPVQTKPKRSVKPPLQGALDFGPSEDYRAPPVDLLKPPPEPAGPDTVGSLFRNGLEQNARMLKTVLEDFGVRGDIVKVRPGPVVTLYELEPAPGTKSSRVIGLADDIARSMSSLSARVAVVPGRNVIGIELPNQRRELVCLRELIASDGFIRGAGPLTLVLGKDIGGAPVFVDLSRMPHLLVAGTTGSGKSVAINAMILSLLYRLSPDQCRLIMIDPKMLELSVYEGIPHLLSPVVTEPGKAVVALKWTVREMEERYRAMSQLGVRNIAGYNARVREANKKGEQIIRRVQTGFDDDNRPVFEEQTLDLQPLPLIVVIVDEMADLMLVAGKDIESAVQRLSQMARAAGIHLIMATQRPSVDVITGTIKANFPTRVSFQVTSKIDSRTILGETGAEQLLGQGDMLFMAAGGRVSRVHGPFVSDSEVDSVVQYLKAQGEPDYLPEITEADDESPFEALGGDDDSSSGDTLYDEAVAIVARDGKASTSLIQRRLQIGYNRAARLMERMEAEGVVSKPDRVGRREVLISDHSA
ncbi:MAG: DNA translocase FtsK 4TM domain-containing protein [Hyphomicrobiales bacterium]|nr:DNA translocase FtsK 4TM domain-containing protein [Hyphomicrobiales bacterium]